MVIKIEYNFYTLTNDIFIKLTTIVIFSGKNPEKIFENYHQSPS